MNLSKSFFSSWNQFFMSMAFFVAMKSKDRSTRVGAIIVDRRRRIVSAGYNGFPRGVDDDKTERHRRPLKYLWMYHAERNALDNADVTPGCVLYTPWIPCAPCAGSIIQKEVKEVVHYYPFNNGFGSQMFEIVGCHDWMTSIIESRKMLREAGVKLRLYDGDELVTEILQVCGEKVEKPRRRSK